MIARQLYTLCFYLLLPLLLLRLWWRSRRVPAYRQRVAERFGYFAVPTALKDVIWIHAVSVGEVVASVPMVRRLLRQYPDRSIVMTTMTLTGSQRLKELLGEQVFHVYAPYDLPAAQARFIRRIKPTLLIIMETELWPNAIHACYQHGILVVVANARLSERSARGYQRFRALTAAMLREVSQVVAQYPEDGERFCRLGLPAERLQVSGSIKLDIDVSDSLRQQATLLKQHWSQHGERPIVIAASTHEGEDRIILDAYKKVLDELPSTLLILVPRHPERFDSVAELVKAKGLNVMRRSDLSHPSRDSQVMVGDTMGELMLLYGCSDIAVVGGSFIANGGHNMLEPACWGLPLITGSSDFNFAEISRGLQQTGGLCKVEQAADLADQLVLLLKDPSLLAAKGKAARQYVDDNRGALERLLAVIAQQLQ